LREALRKEKKVGIAHVVIKSRQHVAAILPYEEVLLLEILRYQNEIRSRAELKNLEKDSQPPILTKKELEVARQLVGSMSGKWQPEKYHDEYRDRLLAWIEKKAELGEQILVEEKTSKRAEAKVVDFMQLLKRSVDEAQRERRRKKRVSRK